MTEKIFKIGLIVLGSIFLMMYYLQSLNGRYQHISEKDIGFNDIKYAVLDTREGTTYMLVSGKEKESEIEWIAVHPQKGTLNYDILTGKKK